MKKKKKRSSCFSCSRLFVRTRFARQGFLAGAVFSTFVVLSFAGCVERTPPEQTEPRHRQLTPADHEAIKENILKEAPQEMTHPINARLSDKAVYLGAEVKGVVQRGIAVRVFHYWKVLKPMPGWRMFTHLNGPGGKSSFVNVDHVAIGGRYPVEKWKPGEIIRNVQILNVPKDWPHKTLEIYTGIWKPGEGRLKVEGAKTDGEDRILVASLELGKRYGVDETISRDVKGEKRYVVKKVDKPIEIDGRATEEAWANAPSTGVFVRSADGSEVGEDLRTEAKLLWDDKFLYVFFNCADTDIWANIDKRDGALWTQEAVRIMVDANKDKSSFIDIQVSPKGTIADSYYADAKDGQSDWNSGVKAEVVVHGTLNKRGDEDKGWTVEMAIPMKSIMGKAKPGDVNIPPREGDKWRANLFRIDFPKGESRIGLAWKSLGREDFLVPERFGTLVFGDSEGNVPVKKEVAEPRKDEDDKQESEEETEEESGK